MRRKVVAIEAGANVTVAARLMRENGCGFLPVVDSQKRVLGVITDRDIVVRVCARDMPPESVHVESVMSRDLLSCGPGDSLSTAIDRMSSRQKSRILVLEGDRLVGILSLADIAQVEQPLQLARFVREVTAREVRLEHR
jgi:CBS domain-containing protein